MLTKHNELGIELGCSLRGHAEGSLAIVALLLIALVLIWTFRRRSS